VMGRLHDMFIVSTNELSNSNCNAYVKKLTNLIGYFQ
jgi:hypothetical protein